MQKRHALIKNSIFKFCCSIKFQAWVWNVFKGLLIRGVNFCCFWKVKLFGVKCVDMLGWFRIFASNFLSRRNFELIQHFHRYFKIKLSSIKLNDSLKINKRVTVSFSIVCTQPEAIYSDVCSFQLPLSM